MAEYTNHYNLEKQQANEYISIEGINENFDIIDNALKNNGKIDKTAIVHTTTVSDEDKIPSSVVTANMASQMDNLSNNVSQLNNRNNFIYDYTKLDADTAIGKEIHTFVISGKATPFPHGFLDCSYFNGDKFSPAGKGSEPVTLQVFSPYHTGEQYNRVYNHRTETFSDWVPTNNLGNIDNFYKCNYIFRNGTLLNFILSNVSNGGVIGIAPSEVGEITDIPIPNAWSVAIVYKHASSVWTVKWFQDGIPDKEYINQIYLDRWLHTDWKYINYLS